MAELHELRPSPGSVKNGKRKGRGPGSGNGKTAGRGEKGQNSRSGGGVRPGFEGGQMPLQRRIPKRGFTPLKRKNYQIVNLADFNRISGTEVSGESLKAAGLVRSEKGLVKILGLGDVGQSYSVKAHKFSGSAVKKIESAGGSVTVIGKNVEDAQGG